MFSIILFPSSSSSLLYLKVLEKKKNKIKKKKSDKVRCEGHWLQHKTKKMLALYPLPQVSINK